MFITIWRHGQAGQALRDRDRELTPQGESELARGLPSYLEQLDKRSVPRPTRAFYSRWTRTSQTMNILQRGLPECPTETAECLIPGSSPMDVEEAFEGVDFVEGEHILLVSHQPLVSRLADRLLGDPGRVPGLNPGGLVCLQAQHIAQGLAALCFWALPPGYEAGA